MIPARFMFVSEVFQLWDFSNNFLKLSIKSYRFIHLCYVGHLLVPGTINGVLIGSVFYPLPGMRKDSI